MNIVTKIYGLVNPVSGEIFYLGRTSMSLSQRLTSHKRDGKKKDTPKARYIKWIQWMGLQPEIVELDSLTNATIEEIREKEQAYIDFYGLTRELANSGDSSRGGTGDNARIDWNDDLISRLGTMPDWEIAKELGCSRTTVGYMRNIYNIPKHGNKYRVNWDDVAISKLGTMSDTSLAKKLGCHRKSVEYMRTKFKIPVYKETNKSEIKRKKWVRLNWTPDMISKLGTVPDHVIAHEFQVSENTIIRKRRALNIKGFVRVDY